MTQTAKLTATRKKVRRAPPATKPYEERLTNAIFEWMKEKGLLAGRSRKELVDLKKGLRGEVWFFFS